MDVLDNLNRGFLQTTDSLVALLRTRFGESWTNYNKKAGAPNPNKRCRIAIKLVGDQESIDHCVRICRNLEAQEKREVLGLNLE